MAPVVMWIGLGSIGRSACASLIEHANLDSPLLLYNRTAKRAHDLAASLPRETTKVVASIPEGISQADIIFTCVSDDRAAEETYQAICRANGSASKTVLAGKVLVGMETVAPETANRIAQLVQRAGGEYVACPVVGPPQAAAQGMLLAIPAGPAAALEKIVPYLTGRTQSSKDNHNGRGVLARALIGPFVDREAGTALKMKIIANTFILNAAAQLAEAYTLGEKCGVGVDAVRQFVDINFVHGGASSSASAAAAATNPFAVYSARMLGGAYFAPGDKAGAVGLGIKDAKHALEMAEEVGVVVRNPATVVYWAEKVVEHGGRGGGLEEGDIAGMYGAVRKEAGLPFENGP